MPSTRPFAQYIDDNQDALIKRLADAVAIASVGSHLLLTLISFFY